MANLGVVGVRIRMGACAPEISGTQDRLGSWLVVGHSPALWKEGGMGILRSGEEKKTLFFGLIPTKDLDNHNRQPGSMNTQ